MQKLEYLWLDGCTPTTIRSKTKVVKEFYHRNHEAPEWGFDPLWGFDGSSTQQANGDNSDCVLKPIKTYINPLEENSTIILCEVYNVDTSPHVSNTRKKLIDTLEDGDEEWVGFEQEYTLFNNKTRKPLGWPEIGTPPPQGDYYCGRNAGESISKEHLDACIDAGISICGTNAEVMLGQWEYQIGAGRAVDMSDDLWVARWLLERICEQYDVTVSLNPKPIEGDWNGAGCHTNFSTKEMREDDGYDKIIEACEKLSKNPQEHIDVYGVDNNKRLTGLHETCSITEFRYGISYRGASIRIPWQVGVEKRGYLEDRRPSANCDPYLVSQKLIETVCR